MKITLTQFKNESNINPRLIGAVVRKIGGWESFKDHAQNVRNYGADSGFSGFIYYRETIAFTKRNLDEIIEYAEQLADDIGEGDYLQMIAGFNCLRSDKLTPAQITKALFKKPKTDYEDAIETRVMNALAWFALEEVSRHYCDLIEND